MGQERRKFIRFKPHNTIANCMLLASGKGRSPSRFTVFPIQDVSMGGASVYSEEDLPLETRAFMNIDLDSIMQTVGVIGKVIWRRQAESGYILGLEFCSWPKRMDKDSMADYIENKLTYNIASEEDVVLG